MAAHYYFFFFFVITVLSGPQVDIHIFRSRLSSIRGYAPPRVLTGRVAASCRIERFIGSVGSAARSKKARLEQQQQQRPQRQ